MPSDERLSALQAFDIADSMQAAAAAALNLRRATRASLSAEAYEALVEKETSLRYDADRYRAVGITLLAGTGKITTQQLLSGIDSATEAINRTKEIGRVLNILSSLVTLGVTIAGGNAPAIAKQLVALNATVKATTV